MSSYNVEFREKRRLLCVKLYLSAILELTHGQPFLLSVTLATIKNGHSMSSSDWATVIYSYTFVTGALGSVIWFIAKKAIHHVLQEQSEELKKTMAPAIHELTPNGGGSVHDKISLQIIPMLENLTERQVEIGDKLSKLEGAFEQHIKEHG